jgi:hypothetical protein
VDGTSTANSDCLTQAAVLTSSSIKHIQQNQHEQSPITELQLMMMMMMMSASSS